MEKPGIETIFKYLAYPKEACRPGREWSVVRSYSEKEFSLALEAFGSSLPKPDMAKKEHRIFLWGEQGTKYIALAERAR